MTQARVRSNSPFTYKGYTKNVGVKPKQKIAESKKDKDWFDESGDYYRSVCIPAVDRVKALRNYRLANGILDESEYLYVTNPTNTKKTELQGSPGKLKNWDIISPNIMLLMGEKAKRTFPPVVYARNSQHDSLKAEEENRILVREIQKQFVNAAIAEGIPFDEEQITMKFEDIAKSVRNIPDLMASQGQDILEYIMDLNQLPRKFRKGFYHYLCQNVTFSYKDVCKGETIYDSLNPLDVSYLCSDNHDFIHDGEAVKVDHRFSVNEIYDRFQDAEGFDKELKDYLDCRTGDGDDFTKNIGTSLSDVINPTLSMFDKVFGSSWRFGNDGTFLVQHVIWRSQTEVGILTTFDPDTGELIQIEVDRSYKALPDDIIKWEWRDQICENYCIDDTYWIGGRVVPIQNGKKAKLLVNGRNFIARDIRTKSLPEKGEPFQKAVNIIKYRAEGTLAKSLDKVITFPLSLLPTKGDWDEDKFFYYLRSFSFLFFDDSKQNAASVISALKSVDLSMLKDVGEAYQLVQIIKNEWDEICGINPQRKGQVSASAGMTVTREAQERSYIMSEEIFIEYDEFEREEMEAMLEISKFAFYDGLQASFVRQDGSTAYINMKDPSSFLYSDLGVFVKNSGRELANLEAAKQQAIAFAQNEVDPKSVISIIEAGDFAKIHKVMDNFEERAEQRRQQAAQLEADKTAAIRENTSAVEEFNYYKSDLDNLTKLQVAEIQAGIAMSEQLRNLEGAGLQSTPEYGKIREDLQKNQLGVLQNATQLQKLQVDREKIKADERNNIRDNKTALKNKVSGEK